MKTKIVILGCENSHAESFLCEIKNNPAYADLEVVGVYSDEPEEAERLSSRYGVPNMASFDEAVGEVDGVIITARHGARHLAYARPYLREGAKMFIDKPITAGTEDALTLGKLLKENRVILTGGSSCRLAKELVAEKEKIASGECGKVLGGFVRAPLDENPRYGGIWFYAQHLVEIVSELFGRYPESVSAKRRGDVITVHFDYADYSVTGELVQDNYIYHTTVSTEKAVLSSDLSIDGSCFSEEFARFYGVLGGRTDVSSYEDFIAPVFVIDALVRSLASGKAEKVNGFCL